MTEILIAKDLMPRKVQRRGVITVEAEMATLVCKGMRIDDIPLHHRRLELVLREAATRMIARQAVRGVKYYDHDGVHVYGPFPSYEFNDHLVDIDTFDERDSQECANLTRPTPQVIGAFADYLIVISFFRMPEVVEYEIPKEGLHGTD